MDKIFFEGRQTEKTWGALILPEDSLMSEKETLALIERERLWLEQTLANTNQAEFLKIILNGISQDEESE